MAVAATAKTGGRAPSSKYLRIGQAKNEKSVSFIRSFIHFDMEWFPLSVFYLLYFMKLWMHGIKSRIGPIFNDFVCVCVCTVRTHHKQAYREKNPILFLHSLASCLLSWNTYGVWYYVYQNVVLGSKTLNGMAEASTMNFHCCC